MEDYHTTVKFKKKGEIEQGILTTIFTVLLFVFVLYYFLSSVNRIGSSASYEKRFLAEDISLLMDAVQLMPGNVDVIYSPFSSSDQKKFSYSFMNSEVQVSEGKFDVRKEESYFATDKNVKIRGRNIEFENNPQIIRITKEGNGIHFSQPKELRKANLNFLKCGEYKAQYTKGIKPSGDNGFAESIARIGASDFSVGDGLEINVEINQRTKNYLKIFFEFNQQSQRIACEIANKISESLLNEKEILDGVGIIPFKGSGIKIELSRNYDSKIQGIISSAVVEGIKNAER